MARAMATRWHWPPESSCGRRSARWPAEPDLVDDGASRGAASSLRPSLRWARSGSAMRSNTLMRGSSEPTGSWKTTWICGRSRRTAPPPRCVMSVPSSLMLPAVGSIRRRMMRARVVLPEPDSPTRPTASPGPMSRSTSVTALTRPLPRWPLTSNSLTRPRTSTSGVTRVAHRAPRHRGCRSRGRRPAARGQVGRSSGQLGRTALDGEVAAIAEDAALDRARVRRHRARDGGQRRRRRGACAERLR